MTDEHTPDRTTDFDVEVTETGLLRFTITRTTYMADAKVQTSVSEVLGLETESQLRRILNERFESRGENDKG